MRRLAPVVALAVAGCAGPVLAVAACAGPGPVPAVPSEPPGTPVVVTLGDSVPAGTACGCDPFPDRYARLVSPGAVSVNLAQSGDTSADVRTEAGDAAVRADLRRATVVLIMVGANDLAAAFAGGRDDGAYEAAADDVQANVAATVDTVVRAHGTPVTVLVLGYWNVVKDGAAGLAAYGAAGLASARSATRYCNLALRRAAAQTGARYVPTTATFRGDHRTADPTGMLAPDGDHPNAAGHEAIAEEVYAAVPAG
jgi:lysophospholipase L1-like esterase